MKRLLCITSLLITVAMAATTDYTATTNQCTSFKSCSDWHAYDENNTLTIAYSTTISGWTTQPFTGSISITSTDGTVNLTSHITQGTWTIMTGGTASYPTYTGTLHGNFSAGGISGTVTHTIYNHAVKMGRGPMVRQSLDQGGSLEITN